MARLSVTVVICLNFAVLLPAQAVFGGDYVVADYSGAGVLRVTPAGAASVLYAGPPLQGPSGVAVNRQREVIVADFSAAMLFRIDTTGVIFPVASVPSPIRVTVDQNGDYIVTSLTPGNLLRVTPGGAVTTIRAGFSRPFGVAVDPTGDYLITEDTSGRLTRVSRDGANATVLATGLGLPQGVAVFSDGDFAVMSGNPDRVMRVPRSGGSWTLLVGSQPLGNPCGMVENFSGDFALSESGNPNGNRIVTVDAAGNLAVVASGGSFASGVNLESLGRVPTLAGPNTPTTGTGASYSLDLELPQDAGLAFTLAASSTVFPGLGLPGGDVRSLALNPDFLFLFTFLTDVPPYTTGWSGSLDGFGRASASLNLTSVPPGFFTGGLVYVQGATLDGTALNGIRSLTNLLALRFQ